MSNTFRSFLLLKFALRLIPIPFTIFLITTQATGQSFTQITSGPIANDGGDSAGASWGDYDNDGDLDLYVTNRATEDNFLYRNNGDGTFTAITSGPLVSDEINCTGSSWGDYDGDGDLDLFVSANGRDNLLFSNNGNGSFSQISSGSIVNDGKNSRGCAWGDYNNDGHLDLFVANSGAVENFLYKNNGNGTFQKITSGDIVEDIGNSRGCAWGDYDNDNDLDLFVANANGEDNFLYRNDGNGSFTKITSGRIVTGGGNSFSPSWGDYDNDGDLDLFVANTGGENNFLYQNNGDGTFDKIGSVIIADDGGLSMGSAWADFNNDGNLDLFVTTDFNIDNVLYRNDGNGSFTKLSSEDPSSDVGFTWGTSWGDMDNDGDLDLFMANIDGGDNFLYSNNGSSNNWINIKCVGTESNTSAIGAKIRVTARINGNSIEQLREISGQTGYLSQNSLNAEFGLGDATAIDMIKVEWPNGIVQTLTNESVNQFLTITESSTPQPPDSPSDVVATVISSSQVNISWNDNSDNEAQFRIERKIDSGSYSLLTNVGADVTNFSDTGLNPVTTYQYRVRSENTAGNSSFTTSSTATTFDVAPSSPSDVVATVVSSSQVDISWNDNSDNETEFRIERKIGSGSYSLLTTVGADTANYSDTGLNPATTYQYRVRSENAAGNSSFTTSNTVTTTDVAPSSPSNFVATVISSHQVDLVWVDNADNEIQFRIERRISAGSYSFLDAVGPNVINLSDTTVIPNTTYEYRVQAENSVGSSSFATSNQVTTPDDSSDQQPPQISNPAVSSSASGQSSTISTVLTDNIGIQSATLFYRLGGASSYSSTSMTNTSGDSWQGTIPASFITERGVEYYFTAQDAGGNTATFPINNPQSNPQVIEVTSSDLSFSSPNLAYRMISVPIDLDNSSPAAVLEANLGPYDDTQWRLLKYINGINREFTKASIGNFDPGIGFWLITRGAKPLLTGSGKSVTTAQNYVITLPSGWSQIGNPFAFTVNWSDVIKNGNVDDVLVGYQGSANDATGYDFTRTQLQPFQGYFVNNQEAINVTIEIPPQSATDTTAFAKQAALPALSTLQSDEWVLQLTARSGRLLDKDNYIGVMNDASDTWDRNDFSEAPFFDSFVSLYFPHDDWEVYPGLYTGDFRSTNSDGHFWDFHVKSNIANSDVVLNLANIQNLPSEMDVVLIDKASRISISLLEQASYIFPSGEDGAERDFRIVVGESDFVESNDFDFSGIPEAFILLQNYPNPFNPETKIDYELPSESEVKIAIYNLRGQRVRVLLDAQQNAGHYTVSWDGKSTSGLNVSSGVYLVHVRAGKFVSVRKVLLTK